MKTWENICHYKKMNGFPYCVILPNLFSMSIRKVSCTVKKGYLIDFGKACLITRSTARKYTSFYNHIASEVLRGHPVSTSSDVFSLGVIISSVGKTLQQVSLKSLGKQCKDTKPTSRPSMPEVLQILERSLQL